MKPQFKGLVAAIFGLVVTTLMILVKVVPLVPGHFTRYEWIALAIWAGLGLLIRTPPDETYFRRRAEATKSSPITGATEEP
jgi:hypothetical protein